MSNGILTKNVPGWRKADRSDMTNLDKARIPRYAAMNLFLKVIAYILRQKSRQPGVGRTKANTVYRKVMKMSEDDQRKKVSADTPWYQT